LTSLLHTLLFTSTASCVQAKDKKKSNVFEAPTYRVKARKGNNFITSFGLRSEDDKAKWILRGVGILCSID